MNKETPRQILNRFYTENHLDQDGGNSKSYVKIEASKSFHFYIPNFDARRKAVAIHDIHHILTGYKTTFKGECEISAWEIASGCKKYWAAFLIDTSGVMLGIPLYLPSVLKAFARGRRTKNLYGDLPPIQMVMDTKTEELHKELLLDKYPYDTKAGWADVITLGGFAIFGLIYSLFLFLTLPVIIIYSTIIALFVDRKA